MKRGLIGVKRGVMGVKRGAHLLRDGQPRGGAEEPPLVLQVVV